MEFGYGGKYISEVTSNIRVSTSASECLAVCCRRATFARRFINNDDWCFIFGCQLHVYLMNTCVDFHEGSKCIFNVRSDKLFFTCAFHCFPLAIDFCSPLMK